MDKKNIFLVKAGCYASNISMSVVGNLSPLLFLTFHELYDISYSLLGLLVLINFCTQLGVDLIFTVFTKYFNVKKVNISHIIIPLFSLYLFVFALYTLFVHEFLLTFITLRVILM